MIGRRTAVVLVVSVALAACGSGDPADGPTGFVPVRTGASGFADGAPQPNASGQLSVSKTADGATFFARVEDAGEVDLPEGENVRFRLAGVEVPTDGDCLADTSTRHLNGVIRGAQEVRFAVAPGAELDDPDGVPVDLWSRRIWVNGEVLARGYGTVEDGAEEHGQRLEAAQEFARERREGVWNEGLCPEGADGPAAPSGDDASGEGS